MAEDREILKEIWSGQIPVQFTLSSIEVVTMQQPEPYYAMVSRVTYFPLVMDKVLKYFSRFVTELKHNCHDLWLEFEGQPLKWNYPIGLLFDLLSKDIKLPWTITVHFEDFPEEEIIRLNNRPLIEANFMSTIKEADYIKHRSQVINAMQKKEHNQLWLGLLNDKFDQFWLVNRKLMEQSNGELFKHIPIRFYHHTDCTSFVQMLIKPTTDAGQTTLFKHVVLSFMPSLDANELDEGKCGFRFITHGIEPPLDTPIQWLSEHLSYPDNFIHVCVTPH